MKDTKDPIDVHVGQRLRLLRTAKRESLESVGGKVAVTYQQIQKYETGANRVSASTLYKLAHAMGVEVGYFFEGYGDGPGPSTAVEALVVGQALDRIENPRVRQAISDLVEAMAR